MSIGVSREAVTVPRFPQQARNAYEAVTMPAAPVGRDSDKFLLRLPDGMRQQIAQIAEANGRSMNTEIVLRLQQSLDAPLPVMTPEVFERLFGGLLTRVEKIERKLEP
jgi:hypothetical protein